MRQILNTLYVMTQNAYFHLENDTLRVDVEREKKLQVPLHHLGSDDFLPSSFVCVGSQRQENREFAQSALFNVDSHGVVSGP